MRNRLPTIFWLVFLGGASLQADILHLSDGSQCEGELVRRDARYIAFRIWDSSARASLTKIFPTRDVVRIVPSKTPELPEEPEVDLESGPTPAWHYDQMIREAFELLDDRDPRSALRAMQRVARRAPEESIKKIEAFCKKHRGLEFAELLADTRIECAEMRADGGAPRISYVTRYEAPALCTRLVARYQKHLARKFDGKTVAHWSETPGAYSQLTPDSKDLVDAARRAAGLIGIQLKHDKALWESRDERRALIELRKGLTRLVATITSITGYTSFEARPNPENPADRKLRELAIEQARQEALAAEAEAKAAEAESDVPVDFPANDPPETPFSDEPNVP
ncbi:MAG: hypothetical protein AB7N71_01485 [Phycisphaerae bacterium]